MSKERPTIQCANNGPLIVKHLDDLTGVDAEAIETKSTIALCRCGQSKNKPFCDGTHAKVGFSDEKSDDRVPDQRQSYAGTTITIHDNRGLCSHAGFCTDNLTSVFQTGTEPWINPDGADVEQIVRVIAMCPSGALSYTLDGVEHRDLDRPPAIRITANGPLSIEGGVELRATDDLDGASTEHRTLCRCGQSKNKPFCDGAHWYANFRDDGKFRVGMKGDLVDGTAVSADVKGVDVSVVRNGDTVTAEASGKRLNVTIDPRWGEILVDLAQVAATTDESEPTSADKSASGGTRQEPHNSYIHELAAHGLQRVGAHGPVAAMGVPRYELPSWDDLQMQTAQLDKLPQLEDVDVGTELIVGPRAARPLRLEIPIIVSDMSFGALSFEAKVSLARGAELAGTGICSGEGGMLPEEQEANSRYFYELASARFGFAFEQLERVQAFHFKCGQGAKTGTGGHLPGQKVTERIARVRGLTPGQDAISPPRFPDWNSIRDYREFATEVRERTGGIPIGFKLSAQHIERDIDAALQAGADYVILDGRGGATGAAPRLFRDNISVPTLPALARARKHLDAACGREVTLFITGGLRTPADFAKALALGADGIAIANSAIQAIGCVGARQCNSDTCPTGIATQNEALRALLDVEEAPRRLARFLHATVHLMATLARACGHTHLNQFSADDLTTWKRDVAYLTGVEYGGVVPL